MALPPKPPPTNGAITRTSARGTPKRTARWLRHRYPPPVMAKLYAEDPVIAELCIEFAPTAKRMLRALAAGLPTLRENRD